MLFCHDVMQHVRFCFAPALYASPFFRLFSRVTGRPGSAGKANMVSYMRRGESLALPPGGFEGKWMRRKNNNETRFTQIVLIRQSFCYLQKPR